MSNPILFFDGSCKFCNGWVLFILKHEKNKEMRFAHLQDEDAQQLILCYSEEPLKDSIYFLKNGQLHYYSDAAIEISQYLKNPYRAMRHLRWIPKFIRDAGYRLIAKYRIRFAGKTDQCIYPAVLKGRTLS